MFSIVALALFWSTAAEATPSQPPPAAMTMQDPPVWLGVYLEDAADGGVQVLGLVPGGPAERGGIRQGDVLLGIGTASVLDLSSLNESLRLLKPGQRAQLRLLRDGKTETLGLLLGDRRKIEKDKEASLIERDALRSLRFPDALGIEVETIPAELRTHYGAPAEAGALVVRLDPEGPGARAGLKVGDVLVRAGARPVEGPADVVAGLIAASSPEVPFAVVRARKAVTVSVPRPAVPQSGMGYRTLVSSEAKTAELAREVARLRARVAELEAELEKARRE